MFSYYGSKSKVVDLYPSPKFGKIIEPFAGSARYSLKYFDRDVLLVDKDVFILVYMTDSTYRKWNVAGWVTGSQGKRIGQLTNMQGGQRYQVAIAQLEDIDRLVPA